LESHQMKWLVYLIYLQAAVLAVTYAEGMWSALTIHDFSVTLPAVVEHGISSAGFALMTAAVGFFALLKGYRNVALSNIALFVVTVVAGSTGFSFLSNTTDSGQIAVTNLSMIATIALAMPITGFSLIKISSVWNGKSGKLSPPIIMIYLALVALGMTIVAGSAMLSTSPSWYPFAVSAHVGVAALMVTLVLGVLVTSVMGAFEDEGSMWDPQIVAYSLIALGAAAIAGADGVVYMTSGDISYVVVMAEVGVIVYIFLMVASASAYRRRSEIPGIESPTRGIGPGSGRSATHDGRSNRDQHPKAQPPRARRAVAVLLLIASAAVVIPRTAWALSSANSTQTNQGPNLTTVNLATGAVATFVIVLLGLAAAVVLLGKLLLPKEDSLGHSK
jgi:hypothetical protein